MDLGITNILTFYLRSWLILSTVISRPCFDHRLTLAIYLNASVSVSQYKRNREFRLIHSPKFNDTPHVSKNLIKTSYFYIRPKSLITPYSTQRTPPQCSFQWFLCAWQDQMVLFNIVKAASTWDFESDDKLKSKVLEHEHDVECNKWNAECILKLKEAVASARQLF